MQPASNFNKKVSAYDGLTEVCKRCVKIESVKRNEKKKSITDEFWRTIF